VDRVAQRNDEGAEKLLRQILDNAAAPADVRNLASLALARVLYERKNYEEAWTFYAQVHLPLVEQDVVMLEWAWDVSPARTTSARWACWWVWERPSIGACLPRNAT